MSAFIRFLEQKIIDLINEKYELFPDSVKGIKEDFTYKIYFISKEGDNYLLKIYGSDYNSEILNIENSILRYLNKENKTYDYPAIVSPKNREEIEIKDDRGNNYIVRLFKPVSGRKLKKIEGKLHTKIFYKLGRFLGELSKKMLAFSNIHDQKKPELGFFNIKEIESNLNKIEGYNNRQIAREIINKYKRIDLSELVKLSKSFVHGKINSDNVYVKLSNGKPVISGISGFENTVYTFSILGLVSALSNIMVHQRQILKSISEVVKGFNEVKPLEKIELKFLFAFINIYLLSNLVLSYSKEGDRKILLSDFEEVYIWGFLKRLSELHPNLVYYYFRNACGFEPCPKNPEIIKWLENNKNNFSSVIGENLNAEDVVVIDLSSKSKKAYNMEISDVSSVTKELFKKIKENSAKIGIGRYDEQRVCYTSNIFKSENESRSIHIGMDLFLKAGSCVYAPMKGKFHSFNFNNNPLDYGPTIILEHSFNRDTINFYTLYGHLSLKSLEELQVGKVIEKGECFAEIGNHTENGGWAPHLHFQIILDMLDFYGDFYGVSTTSELRIWNSICPDPNLILNIPKQSFKKVI